jgi:hypothetical protein
MNYKEYCVRIFDDGMTAWQLNNEYHREDGPAIEYPNGSKYYYKYGKLHRDNGPAIIDHDGSQFYYREGVLHREDGPAIEYANGVKGWYINGACLIEEEFEDRIRAISCEGKIIDINGEKYKLVRVEREVAVVDRLVGAGSK